MNFKDTILTAIEREINICKRLFTLLPPGSYDYKPIENTRTILELLQYLTWVGASSIDFYVNGTSETQGIIYTEYSRSSKEVTPGNFLERMDEQWKKIQSLMEKVDNKMLEEKIVMVPWGEKFTMGMAIVETCIKWLAGYKMQLFLFMKMSSNPNLNTGDCWIITEAE